MTESTESAAQQPVDLDFSQTADELTAAFVVPDGVVKSAIKAKFGVSAFSLSVAGTSIYFNDEKLLGKVDPDECFWQIDRGTPTRLTLTFGKQSAGKEWRALTAAAAEAAVAALKASLSSGNADNEKANGKKNTKSSTALYNELTVDNPDVSEEVVEQNEHDEVVLQARFEELREEHGLSHDSTLAAFFALFDNCIQLYRLNMLSLLLTDVVPVCRRRGGDLYIKAIQADAFVKWKQGKYRPALALFLEIERAIGKSAALCENIAHTYSSLNDYPAAEKYFREAQRALEGEPGNSKLGGILLGLGLVRDRQGKFGEAGKVVRQAYEFYRRAAGGQPNSLQAKAGSSLFKILLSLAGHESEKNEKSTKRRAELEDEAESLARECLDVYITTCGARSPLTASAWAALGHLLWDLRNRPPNDKKKKEKKRTEAAQCFLNALEIEAAKDHFDLIKCMESSQDFCNCHLSEADCIVRASFRPAFAVCRAVSARVDRELPSDGNAGAWHKQTATTLTWGGELADATKYFDKAIPLLRAETSVDTSALLKECADLREYCQRCLRGEQEVVGTLDVSEVGKREQLKVEKKKVEELESAKEDRVEEVD